MADAGKSTAIGYATAAQLGVTTWGTATGLAGTETVTKYTYYGDLNLDGRVNADDYARIDRSMAKGGLTNAAVWIDGDGNVVTGPPAWASNVDPDRLCGIYSMGVADSQIHDDLMALRQQRIGGAIAF